MTNSPWSLGSRFLVRAGERPELGPLKVSFKSAPHPCRLSGNVIIRPRFLQTANQAPNLKRHARGEIHKEPQDGLTASSTPATLANTAKPTETFPGYRFSWIRSLHGRNFSVCTRRISDKTCDVAADQGLMERHADQRLLL